MDYKKVDGVTHIYVGDGETERQVLRAIAKASFDLARPAGLGWLHFNDKEVVMLNEAEMFISLPPRYSDIVVDMDYVQGRQCKTVIHKKGDGHFTLSNHLFERDRGTPEPMLEKAKKILVGKKSVGKKSVGLASTSHMYKGESLTLRLKEYSFFRGSGENDWDFRKRVFPDMYQIDADRAMEFLVGSSAAEWEEMDKLLYLALASKGKPSHEELIRFAKGFAADPLQVRGQRESD